MNIEIVEFYPIERDDNRGLLTGTLRIKLPDIGIHILGVFVSKKNNSWFFSLPSRQGIDHKTGKNIRYPFIVFDNQDQTRELIAAIREQAPSFIEKKLEDRENSVIFPLKNQQQTRIVEHPKVTANATTTKKTIPIEKQWQDPPKRDPYFKERKLPRLTK